MTTNSNTVIAKEGKTLVYFIHAVICGFVAIPFFFTIPFVAFALVGAIVTLSLVETGFEYNIASNEYRAYKALFGSKWGEWKTITNVAGFDLRISVEQRTISGIFPATSTSWNNSRSTSKSITYDFSYTNSRNQSSILYEFQDYEIAKKFIRELNNEGLIPVTNHVALKMKENLEKRLARRR